MPEYTDETMVYVDPDARKVVDLVEWLPNGKVKQLEMPAKESSFAEASEDKEKKEDEKGNPKKKVGIKGRRPRKIRNKKRYYPWCSYRTAKRVYRVEGKEKAAENYQPLDEVMKKALKEPFWD